MFALGFGGGIASGYLAGRAIVLVLPLLNRLPVAAATLTLAVPYPLYIAADQLHASGVVAVVTAGLVIGAYGPTRLSPSNWKHLDVVWGQIAVLAGAVVFLLAAVQVPDLLSLMNEADMVYLAVIVLAALVARAVVMFGIFPLLSIVGLSRPVDHRYKLAIVWGGLRGAVTLVLALALAPRVRVVGVAPGLTLTSHMLSPERFAQLHALSPLGRSSTPEDVAATVRFALENGSITGTTLLVDGGQHLMRFERDFSLM